MDSIGVGNSDIGLEEAKLLLLLGVQPPIKPEQLFGLLYSLYKNPDLRLAVALAGLFGLRPSELMELEVRERHLYAGETERNRHSAAKPKGKRLALPLDLTRCSMKERALWLSTQADL